MSGAGPSKRTVVLLHGLARTSLSMMIPARHLRQAGHTVANLGYPSRSRDLPTLARDVASRLPKGELDFVTHSMGGIVVRLLARDPLVAPRIRRVVMLAPPNNGSPLVDQFGEWALFGLYNGPAGQALGTRPQDWPRRLGPVSFELGVVAGTRSPNPLAGAFLTAPHDGKVPVESTRVEGMSDHIVLPVTHTWMMNDTRVLDAVSVFLESGRFEPEDQAASRSA